MKKGGRSLPVQASLSLNAKPDCKFDKYVPRHRRHEKVEVAVNGMIQLCQKNLENDLALL